MTADRPAPESRAQIAATKPRNAKVAENLTTHLRGSFPDSLLSHLLHRGTDPLQVMLEFCHARGIEVFCSMRMNDTHDAANAALRPRLKSEHPEYLLGSEARKPLYGQWTAVDYGHPAVRELAVNYIQEVCTRYDVDGVKLDFFRHPVLYKTHAYNGSVGDAERELLTAEFWIQPAANIGSVEVTCNGQRLVRGTTDGDRVKFALAPGLLKPGANIFGLRQPADRGPKKTFLRDIVLQVAYPEGP